MIGSPATMASHPLREARAAGMLGGKIAPPAPLVPGLAQELLWDGKDDLGKLVAEASPTVRVRAGMAVKFGRLIGAAEGAAALLAGGEATAKDQQALAAGLAGASAWFVEQGLAERKAVSL